MIDYFCDSLGVDAACSQRCLYLVFEYMDTTVWHEFTRRKGLFDRQLSVSIFTDICRGIKHLHDLGIAHTDLSLTNLLYSQGQTKVGDLGCSFSAETWVLPRREKGTPHSRAPELWLVASAKSSACSQSPASRASLQTSAFALDRWSLGVCLGILLTGQYIFRDLAEIVSCLGPLTDAEWAGCTTLPGYAKYRVAELSVQWADADTTRFFSSESHVKYPKPKDDSGMVLIRKLLKWAPSARCTVQEALDHEFCGFQPSEQDIVEAIRRCSFEQLGKLVFGSIRGRIPVSDLDLMVGMDLAQFKAHTKSDEVQGVAASSQDSSVPVVARQEHVAPARQDAVEAALAQDAEAALAQDAEALAQEVEAALAQDAEAEVAASSQDHDVLVARAPSPDFGSPETDASMDVDLVLADPSKCACRGTCRSKACLRACNAVKVQRNRGEAVMTASKYQICSMQPAPGKKFCSSCKCECEGCDRCRDRTHVESGRFCYAHRHLVTKGTKYANAYGQHTYRAAWDQELRLTARLAFLFKRMTPQDVRAFLTFARKLCKIREGKLTKKDVVWMMLASALKWPHAVEVFWESVLPLLAGEPTAEDLRCCLVAAIRACDGRTFAEMHAEMSIAGRAATCSGPKWLGEKLQLIHDMESQPEARKCAASSQPQARKRVASSTPLEMPQKKTRISGKSAASSQNPGETVRLGKKSRAYQLLARPSDALKACQQVIDVIEGTDLVWPDSNDAAVIEKFAATVVEIIHRAFNITQDEKDKGAYSALGVARKIILFVSEAMPDAFDKCKMKNVLAWTADEGGHCDSLKSLSGREAREAFGLQPVMIPCWTCLLGCCHSVALRALQQASEKCLIDILKRLNEEGNFAPGPHSVARVLIGRSALKVPET